MHTLIWAVKLQIIIYGWCFDLLPIIEHIHDIYF